MEELEETLLKVDQRAKERQRDYLKIDISYHKQSIADIQRYIKKSKVRGVVLFTCGSICTAVLAWQAYRVSQDLNAEQINYATLVTDIFLGLGNAFLGGLNRFGFKGEVSYRKELTNAINTIQTRISDLEKQLAELA